MTQISKRPSEIDKPSKSPFDEKHITRGSAMFLAFLGVILITPGIFLVLSGNALAGSLFILLGIYTAATGASYWV